MELFCEKYNEKVSEENAQCNHPQEYCKFRTACIIYFMGGEMDSSDSEEVNKEGGTMPTLQFEKGNGLLPAIAQDFATKEVLMLAYINKLAWEQTLKSGKAHYWSRSRNKLWLKGETSGHHQLVKKILVDCDADTVIYLVEQLGGAACHTGHRSCFFKQVSGAGFETFDKPVFDPEEVYKK
ncbi:MAG TPA: phosphoribosyl-AMP cyclohydrolase [Desulfobulbales bacterium]|nr:phosphoribosyl-AMP cyclohydrolase [Desulfobulbales bacterium]